MTCAVNVYLLEKQIMELREELEHKIGADIDNLCSPEVLEINHKIDELLVSYIKLTLYR